jgi:hypothetical protein
LWGRKGVDSRRHGQQQIAFGDDSKKNKGKSKDDDNKKNKGKSKGEGNKKAKATVKRMGGARLVSVWHLEFE